MGWFDWWRRRNGAEAWTSQWKAEWAAAVEQPDAAAAAALRARLEAAGLEGAADITGSGGWRRYLAGRRSSGG